MTDTPSREVLELAENWTMNGLKLHVEFCHEAMAFKKQWDELTQDEQNGFWFTPNKDRTINLDVLELMSSHTMEALEQMLHRFRMAVSYKLYWDSLTEDEKDEIFH